MDDDKERRYYCLEIDAEGSSASGGLLLDTDGRCCSNTAGCC